MSLKRLLQWEASCTKFLSSYSIGHDLLSLRNMLHKRHSCLLFHRHPIIPSVWVFWSRQHDSCYSHCVVVTRKPESKLGGILLPSLLTFWKAVIFQLPTLIIPQMFGHYIYHHHRVSWNSSEDGSLPAI